MLASKEKAERVSYPEIFRAMLRELPWDSLKDCIQANSQLLKRCTIGGHRLDKKRRERFEKIIVREAEKNDFSSEMTTALFAHWYPVNAAFHKMLEDYFASDEYEQYREENDLGGDDYVLPDEVFEKFFDPKDIQKWRILLCFSPLEFSDEQADRIIEEAAGSEEALEQIYEVQAEAAEERKERNRLASENDDLRSRIQELSREDQESREEKKTLRAERDALQKKFEASQVENKRLREEAETAEESLREHSEEIRQDTQKEQKRLGDELKRLQAEVEEWRNRYERERSEARKLQESLKEAEKALAGERASRMARDKEVRESNNLADVLLANIDWREVGRQLRLTPQMKRKFNSLMRSLHYGEDRGISLGGTLNQFWGRLAEQEKELIEKLAESDVREVQNGDPSAYWGELSDEFGDVAIGLEARTVLLQLLQEIFYQTLTVEDLEQAKAPGTAKKKSKKASEKTAEKEAVSA